MKQLWRTFLYHFLFPFLGLIIVKTLSMTYRLRYIDQENERRLLEKDNCTIYATWHQRFLPGVTVLASRKPIAIMVSQSRDGEFIARIGNMFGWATVRGSSSRGGKQALQEIKELSRRGYSIGHVVDGPKGPFGVVKPGLLSMAQATGKAIVPIIFSGEKQWIFNSWDRFMVPKPFSRLIVRFGEPVYVPEELSDAEFEGLRLHLEKTMQFLYEDTDRMWANDNPTQGHPLPKPNGSKLNADSGSILNTD